MSHWHLPVHQSLWRSQSSLRSQESGLRLNTLTDSHSHHSVSVSRESEAASQRDTHRQLAGCLLALLPYRNLPVSIPNSLNYARHHGDLFTFYPLWPSCRIRLQLVQQYHSERCTALYITAFAIARLHDCLHRVPLHTSQWRQTRPMFTQASEWDIVTRCDIVRS